MEDSGHVIIVYIEHCNEITENLWIGSFNTFAKYGLITPENKLKLELTLMQEELNFILKAKQPYYLLFKQFWKVLQVEILRVNIEICDGTLSLFDM